MQEQCTQDITTLSLTWLYSNDLCIDFSLFTLAVSCPVPAWEVAGSITFSSCCCKEDSPPAPRSEAVFNENSCRASTRWCLQMTGRQWDCCIMVVLT